MRTPLILHPSSQRQSIRAVDVEVTRDGASLTVRYRLAGRIADLLIPVPAPPDRTDELWRHTCLEAFVSRTGGGYDEFNFSPSGAWAAYHFDGYRQGMRPLEMPAPQITSTATAEVFELTAAFDIGQDAARLGLCAVIEDREGTITYWALVHPPGKPDFHSPDCLALELAAIEGS